MASGIWLCDASKHMETKFSKHMVVSINWGSFFVGVLIMKAVLFAGLSCGP